MQFTQYSKQIFHLKALISEENSKLAFKQSQIQQFDHKITQLQQQANNLQFQCDQHRKNNSELQQQAQSQNEYRQTLIQQATTKTQDLSALKLNVNELERHLFKRQQQLEKIRQQKFQKIQVLHQMKRTLSQASQEVQTYKNTQEKFTNQLSNLKKTNQNILEDLTNLRQKKASKSSQINITQNNLIERLNQKQDQIQFQREQYKKSEKNQSILVLVSLLKSIFQKQIYQTFLTLLQKPISKSIQPLYRSLVKLTRVPFQKLFQFYVRESMKRPTDTLIKNLRIQLSFFKQFKGMTQIKLGFHKIAKQQNLRNEFKKLKTIFCLNKKIKNDSKKKLFTKWKHTPLELKYDPEEDILKHKFFQRIRNHQSVKRCRQMFLVWYTFQRLIPRKDLSHKILLKWAQKCQISKREQIKQLIQEQATYNDELSNVEGKMFGLLKNCKRLMVIGLRVRNRIKRKYFERWNSYKLDGRELIKCINKVEKRMKSEVFVELRQMMVYLLDQWIVQGQCELDEQRTQIEQINKEVVETQLAQEYLTLKRCLQINKGQYKMKEAIRKWRCKCEGWKNIVAQKMIRTLNKRQLRECWQQLI